jgi:hypothetical protein
MLWEMSPWGDAPQEDAQSSAKSGSSCRGASNSPPSPSAKVLRGVPCQLAIMQVQRDDSGL